MTNDQIAAIAKMLVNAAQQKNVTLRVLAGAAVHIVCPSIATHPKLQRTFLDLDLVAPRGDWLTLEGIFFANGINAKAKGKSWIFDKDGLEIELSEPTQEYANLSARLSLTTPTLPLVDLLLHKLQRVKFEERDVQDTIALLLDHKVAAGEAEDQIDQTYISKLCARHWRLFHSVYDNTVTLEQVLDRYVESEEAQLVWRRIEQIQSEMDLQPKSFGWMVQQFLRKPGQVPR